MVSGRRVGFAVQIEISKEFKKGTRRRTADMDLREDFYGTENVAVAVSHPLCLVPDDGDVTFEILVIARE